MSVGLTVIGSCAASLLNLQPKLDCKVSGTWFLNLKWFLRLLLVWKMILSLQNFKRLLVHLFSLFSVIVEVFPKYGNTILSSNFGTMLKAVFWTNILLTKFCYTFVNKFALPPIKLNYGDYMTPHISEGPRVGLWLYSSLGRFLYHW